MPPVSRDPAVRTVAVLLAGGVGTRVGHAVPKQLVEIGGRPLMEHPLAMLDAHPEVDEIVVLMVAGYLDEVRDLVERGGYDKVTAVLEGADTRSATSARAVSHLVERFGDAEVDVLLHDAARPLLGPDVVDRCVAALREHAAVTVAVPSADTVVEVDDEEVVRGVPARASLRRNQTPQAFRLSVLRRAYERALRDPGFEATDDCTVVLRYAPDVPVRVIAGDERNIKVTRPLDVLIADTLLRQAP